MVRAVSPEQVAVSGTPRSGVSLTPSMNGTVVDIFVTSFQMASDLPKQPLCSENATSGGGAPLRACDLDNTSDNVSPYRYRELTGQPAPQTFLRMLIVTGRNAPNEATQVSRQLLSTLVFY